MNTAKLNTQTLSINRRSKLGLSKTAAIISLCASLIACNSASTKNQETAATPQQKVEKLQIVDCLLPGQIRKLGTQIYQTQDAQQ